MITVDDFLAHHGVKGMRWGVVKKEETSNKETDSKINKKKVAIGIGVTVGVAAVAVGALYVANRYNVSSAAKKAADLAPKLVTEEPTGIIHLTRTKNNGYKPLMTGGVKDAVSQFYQAAAQNGYDVNGGLRDGFARFGERSEKIYVNFQDPPGRRDFAGRTIIHEVIIPELKAVGLNTFDQIKDFAWSEIKDGYEALYDLPSESIERNNK